MFRLIASVSVLGFCFALAGCGKSEPDVYPVTGTVKFADGKPAVGCVVEFASQAESTKGLNARGVVGDDGRFALKTSGAGAEREGAVAGAHKVIVVAGDPIPSNMSSGRGPVEPVPPRYRHYEQSGLSFEVKPGGENVYPIVLNR